LKFYSITEGYSTRFYDNIPTVILAFSKGSLVLDHLMAELATVLQCCSSHPPNYILDWDSDRDREFELPPYESSERISRTKTIPIELGMEENINKIINFFYKVESIHWIDGHRFPTESKVIMEISTFMEKLGTWIFIHGTPRQLQDGRRKWIKEEHSKFVQMLQDSPMKSNFRVYNYLEEEHSSFENHFKVLKLFHVK